MALIKCSECGQKLDKNSTVCPNCGYYKGEKKIKVAADKAEKKK